MKTKSIFLACVMALGIAIGVNAQESQAQQAGPATVAKVDISNTKVVKQEGSKLTIGFDLRSEDVYQPQVVYSLKVSKTEEKNITLMDQKTYPDKIDLESSKTIHKEITYEAPSFLTGKNDIAIEIKSFSGFLLAVGRIDGVNFSGDGQYVSINGSSCKTADGKNIIEQGMLTIEKGKSFEVACEVENKAKDAFDIATSVDVYQNKIFSFGNSILQNSVGSHIQINGGEKKTLSFVVPKIDTAQSYSALFSLQDEKKNRISDISGVMFLVKGDAFLVDNVMFDKQAYVAGDTAEVSLVWDHNLDRIDGREQAPFEAYLTDENGSSCSNETVKSVRKKSELSSKVALPVSSECNNPKIILNGVDVIYSQKVEKKASVVNSGKGTYLENNKKLLGTLLVIILVGCLLLIGFAMSKRKSGSGLKMFLICCFVLGMSVVFSNKASANIVFNTPDGMSVWTSIGPKGGFSAYAYGNGVCNTSHFPPYTASGGGEYAAYTPGANAPYNGYAVISQLSAALVTKLAGGGTERLTIAITINGTKVVVFDKNIGKEYFYNEAGIITLHVSDNYINPFTLKNVVPNVAGKYPLNITVTFAGGSGSSDGYIMVIDPKEPKCGSASMQAYANAPSSNLCTDSLNYNAPAASGGKWHWSCESTCIFSVDSYPFWAPEYCTADTGCGSANGGSYPTAPSGAVLCNAGTASAVTDTGASWAWSCSGLADGTANCSANKLVNTCGSVGTVDTLTSSTPGLCAPGNVTNFTEKTTLPLGWSWTCTGAGGADVNCSASKNCTVEYICEQVAKDQQTIIASCATKNPGDSVAATTAVCKNICDGSIDSSKCGTCTAGTVTCPSVSASPTTYSDYQEVAP